MQIPQSSGRDLPRESARGPGTPPEDRAAGRRAPREEALRVPGYRPACQAPLQRWMQFLSFCEGGSKVCRKFPGEPQISRLPPVPSSYGLHPSTADRRRETRVCHGEPRCHDGGDKLPCTSSCFSHRSQVKLGHHGRKSCTNVTE